MVTKFHNIFFISIPNRSKSCFLLSLVGVLLRYWDISGYYEDNITYGKRNGAYVIRNLGLLKILWIEKATPKTCQRIRIPSGFTSAHSNCNLS